MTGFRELMSRRLNKTAWMHHGQKMREAVRVEAGSPTWSGGGQTPAELRKGAREEVAASLALVDELLRMIPGVVMVEDEGPVRGLRSVLLELSGAEAAGLELVGRNGSKVSRVLGLLPEELAPAAKALAKLRGAISRSGLS